MSSLSVPELTDGTKCWITGWGRLAYGGATPNILHQAQVPIFNVNHCDKGDKMTKLRYP